MTQVQTECQQWQIQLQGIVQGVGFRPFVWHLAHHWQLAGSVCNIPTGAQVVVEGPPERLTEFFTVLTKQPPALVTYTQIDVCHLPTSGLTDFVIEPSQTTGPIQAVMLPDLATCPACAQELIDPHNRRYRYPFISCTYCGPRYSMIRDLPYDRPLTSMQPFTLCPACQSEYADPRDRRFHAQTNACWDCGPQLTTQMPDGRILTGESATRAAVQALATGAIMAIKGLGGYQLVCDATQTAVVKRLRQRKTRPDKPLAVMFPDRAMLQQYCKTTVAELQLLQASQSPIVLLPHRGLQDISTAVIHPGNPYLGAMLPYTPLHHLLLQALNRPLVATSGNRSNEPICIDNIEAQQRLGTLADGFIHHNRKILRPVDDSVVQFVQQQPMVLRRARGYTAAPLAVPVAGEDLLAVGGHLKNTVALTLKGSGQVVLSQHLGDLSDATGAALFKATVQDLLHIYNGQPAQVAHDTHPDYFSSAYAATFGVPTLAVQHHEAHILAVMAEHHLSAPVLGVAWDGLGLGDDGRTLWGGEFLVMTPTTYQHRAGFKPLIFAGGHQALTKPSYLAVAWLYQRFGKDMLGLDLPCVRALSPTEKSLLMAALAQQINTRATTSVGRLFDIVAALLDLHQTTSFEGQAAMAVEFIAAELSGPSYPLPITEHNGYLEIDPGEMLAQILMDWQQGVTPAQIAQRFHLTLVQGILTLAQKLQIPDIVLSGGCFQNRLLLENTIATLKQAGFRPWWPQQIPPNDGGLALGQIMALLRTFPQEEPHVSGRTR